MPRDRMRIRYAATLTLFPALVAGLVLMLALPGQAAAAKPCWERVIDDWLANGTITGTYKVNCYQQALKHVPEDLRDYSNITDAINAAMLATLRGTPGNGSGSGSGTGTGSGSNPGNPSGGSSKAEKNRRLQATPERSYYRRAIDNLGTTSADSLPVPLLVLGGVAVVLMAAGGAGFLARRTRMRRVQLASAASAPHRPDPEPTEQS
jgi:hypothetical protein